MSIVKKFKEFVNESAYFAKSKTDPITRKTNAVYQAIVDAGLSKEFLQPEYDYESPWLNGQAEAYDLDIDCRVDCIPFAENNSLDTKRCVFYSIYISDNVPINEDGDVTSLWIEYGETGYADGPEPWAFYYLEDKDMWDGDIISFGDKDMINPDLLKMIYVITKAINPDTKITPENELN